MAEPAKQNRTPATKQPPRQEAPPPDFGHIPMTEEMDRARWTLPPLRIVAVGIGIFLILVAVVSWFTRYQPVASGTVDQVFAVETADKANVLAAIQVTVRNDSKKLLYVKNLKATLKAGGKESTDEPASAVDYERYFQGFPDLRAHAGEALKPETQVQPGKAVTGTMIVAFPVSKQDFDARQSLTVSVEPYDERAISFAEKK
ncbi:MAG TPA: hypothetical protein VFA60_10010 [Terriglobales bacterium]|nr:hypothetical protein [Terriglobales bacterium]